MNSPTPPEATGKLSLFGLAIRRPVAVTMISLGVVIFGVVSYTRLEVTLLPRFSHPTLTIRTEYPGSAPGEMEQLVTAPVEKQLSIVSGLTGLRSLTRAGLSEIVLEFQWGTPLSLAALEVREKLDRLPLAKGVEPSQILRFSPEDEPILRLAVMGGAPLSRLRLIAEEEIKPRLLALSGVASVQVRGGAPPEVLVELDEGQLGRLGLSVADVADRLAAESINLAGGVLREGTLEYRVRTLSELTTLEEIGEVPVSPPGTPLVKLGDVARVRLQSAEVRVHARANGRPAIELEIFKEADANVVEVARRVNARIWNDKGRNRGGLGGRPLSAILPPETEVSLIYDQSRFIVNALAEVRRTALVGGLLAMGVLLLFLGELRSTLFIVIAIPLSILATFLPMFLGGITLNLISLGGLALGLGMLVDNSIVVLEAIHRLREKGMAPFQAALRGVGEVGGAVTASTLTTVAVFLPMAFVEGVAGQIVGDLALTVVFSLLASLAVAVLVLPMLTVVLERSAEIPPLAGSPPRSRLHLATDALRKSWTHLREQGLALVEGHPALVALLFPYRLARLLLLVVVLLTGLGFRLILPAAVRIVGAAAIALGALFSPLYFIVRGFQAQMTQLAGTYRALLRLVLARPALLLIGIGLLLPPALWSGYRLPQELIPSLHQGVLLTRLEFPPGTSLAATVDQVAEIESDLAALPRVGNTFARIGAEPDDPERDQGGDNIGLIWVAMETAPEMAAIENSVSQNIRARLTNVPDLVYRIGQPPLFTLKPPLTVEIQGEDMAVLSRLAGQVEARLQALPMLRNVKSRLSGGKPELQIRFDRNRLSRHGLSARAVAERVRQKLEGETPLRFRSLDKRVDLRVRVSRPQLDTVTELKNLIVNPGQAVPIPLRAVAEIREGLGPSEIRHVSQRRTALVTASLQGGDLKGAQEAIGEALSGLKPPPGTTYAIGGQSGEMRQSIDSLMFALGLAVFLVYLVLASQFESFLQPFIVLFTIPLAAIGVVWTLRWTGQSLNVLVGLGGIVLVGIVVNNAIVLTATLNRLRKEGRALGDAIVEAGAIRLRPILMTTLTTILGLLPLVLSGGAGAEIRQPIALTIIAGLLTSMVLTLAVIPAACRLLMREKP